jgi:sugar/nucleoside kinase (ribokinase family)
MSSPLVAGLGQLAVAFIGRTPRIPDNEESVELAEIALQPGGVAAVAIATAAALGCRTRLAGRVANDCLGQFALGALRQIEVDIGLVQVGPGALSRFEFATVAEGVGRRGYTTAGDAPRLDEGDIDVDALLDGAGVLLVDGDHPRAQRAAARAARERQIPVVLDATTPRDGLEDVVAAADVLICSERLATELAPHSELGDILRALSRMGPSSVIITLGEAGCVGLSGGEIREQPAYPVDVVDSGDAGAVFLGAFAAATARGDGFPAAMDTATAAAALSCGALGAWAGIPKAAAVARLIG